MSSNENDDPNREPQWDVPSDSSDDESHEESNENGETQVVARRPLSLENNATQLLIFLFTINFLNSIMICGNACRAYIAAALLPEDERVPFSGHMVMQIMRFVTSNFCDSLTSPVPQDLVSRIYGAIFEGPLEHAKETAVTFLRKFRLSKDRASNAEDYGMLGVFLVFEKGEKSLKDIIKTIDIALGLKEGKLSRHKIALIRRILEACYRERDDDRNRSDDNEGGNGSGRGSDDDNPQGGALPLQVRPN